MWWRWIAPVSGWVTVDTFGSNYDTILGVYAGLQVDQLEVLASNDDSEFSLNARIRRNLAPGEYFARVRHFSSVGTGAYTIRVRSS